MTKRAPRSRWASLAAGIDRQGTGGARSVANASPVAAHTFAVGEAQAGATLGGAAEATPWVDESFTLASDGAQTVDLAFLPVNGSEDIKLNGIGQLRTTDWTRSGQTVSVLAAMDARTDDELTVHYQYLAGVPWAPTDALELNIPLQSDGWKYHSMNSASLLTTYVDPAFDDSAWDEGTCPFGHGAYTDADGHPKATTVPNVNTGDLGHVVDFVVRRHLPAGTGITVTVDESNYCIVYADGVQIGGSSTGNPVKFTTTAITKTAPWVLAIYQFVGNGYTNGGCDISVSGTET